MEYIGFGVRWRNWISGCLRSANFSVIINGRLEENLAQLKILFVNIKNMGT